MTVPLDLVCCPVCGAAFERAERAVRCASGHSVDWARQGYLNLLGRAAPANADTADMVSARERFLARGAYDPLADAVIAAVAAGVGTGPDVLEVGAGTGYYLARLLDGLGGRGVALDVSPAAARRAARSHPDLLAVVADAWRPLPMPTAAYDAVLAIFAPRNPAEFARLLRPGGLVVVATPEPAHLVELRSALGLLDIPAAKDERVGASLAADFDPGPRTVVRTSLSLDRDAVVDLVAMGPNAFHHRREDLVEQVARLSSPVSVTLSVVVGSWTRR